ncbi:hypothetical protein R3P38DRAFT_3438706 [Favolaschia claudopus]|uniref:Uncharacterized protein n=1 Tax=Favolaschia claudopus TaxID=2862362 RepID=A0AAV9ZRX7_9AGAR
MSPDPSQVASQCLLEEPQVSLVSRWLDCVVIPSDCSTCGPQRSVDHGRHSTLDLYQTVHVIGSEKAPHHAEKVGPGYIFILPPYNMLQVPLSLRQEIHSRVDYTNLVPSSQGVHQSQAALLRSLLCQARAFASAHSQHPSTPVPLPLNVSTGRYSVVSPDFQIFRRENSIVQAAYALKGSVSTAPGLGSLFDRPAWITRYPEGILAQFTSLTYIDIAPQPDSHLGFRQFLHVHLEVYVASDHSHRYFPGESTSVRVFFQHPHKSSNVGS